MHFHPIEPGDDEFLKQQFMQLLQNIEPYESDIRFSISMPGDSDENDTQPINLSKSEIEQIEEEIREKVMLLRLSSVDELIIQSLFDKEERLSRILVTKDYRILLPDYGIEIQMAPLTKAVYLLFSETSGRNSLQRLG